MTIPTYNRHTMDYDQGIELYHTAETEETNATKHLNALIASGSANLTDLRDAHRNLKAWSALREEIDAVYEF